MTRSPSLQFGASIFTRSTVTPKCRFFLQIVRPKSRSHFQIQLCTFRPYLRAHEIRFPKSRPSSNWIQKIFSVKMAEPRARVAMLLLLLLAGCGCTAPHTIFLHTLRRRRRRLTTNNTHDGDEVVKTALPEFAVKCA